MKSVAAHRACAVAALLIGAGHASAASCTSALELSTAYVPCSGATASSSVSFRQYGDESPVFWSSGSGWVSGVVETTEAYFPDTFGPYRQVSAFGTLGAAASVSGSYRGESESTRSSADLATGALKLAGSTSPVLVDLSASSLNTWVSAAQLRD